MNAWEHTVRLAERIGSWILGSRVIRRRVLAPQIEFAPRIRAALPHLGQSSGNDGRLSDSPVFILSAGWGSGSTLLQRLVISSGQVLVWGEPFDQAAPVQRLAETLMPVRDGWPPEAHFMDDHSPGTLSRGWIANLAPPVSHYADGHRAYLDGWLGQPARDVNYSRWGMKEVRLTIDHARYLKWLYPNARFLFVYRDLYKSYLSCRRKPWTSVWPDHPATRIVPFAHHWRFLLEGFLEGHAEVGGLLVKYEDLISGKFSFESLCDYLQLESIDETLMEKKVGGRSANRHPLILPERLILDAIAGDLRSSLGYR